MESRSVAQVCRRLWNRMWGRAASFRSGSKERCLRLDGLIGVPALLVKTKP